MSSGDRRSALGAAAVTAVLVVVGVLALTLGFQGRSGPPQPVTAQPAATTASTQPAPATTPTAAGAPTAASPRPETRSTRERGPKVDFDPFLGASAPAVLDVPSVGIRSSNFVDLQVAKDGTLNVPGSADEIGLYADGPTPGQLGPAVLGAHVDSKKGPGIFYQLGAVKKGDEITVTRRDKSEVTFTVDKVAVYDKDDFPTEEVYYGDFTRPEIRLVTCGGPYDPEDSYQSNVIVFAHRTG